MQTLHTPRLMLTPVGRADAPAIAAQIGNRNVAGMLARVPCPYSIADCLDWLDGVLPRIASGQDMIHAIRQRELIGCISIEDLDAEPLFGYWLAEPCWGRGFMSEAATALIGHAFASRPISQINSNVFCINEPSLRLQKKLGFAITGSGSSYSLAHKAELDSVHTVLTREAFAAASRTTRPFNHA